jgi:hypothetical protein
MILASALLSHAVAQNDRNLTWEGRSTTLSGGVEFGIPLGEFDHTWGQTTSGLSANIALPLRILPLEIGYDFAWGRMGGEYDAEQAPGNILGSQTGQRVEVNSDVYGHHGLIRLNPMRGQVRPYGEVMLGARHFVTRSVVTTEEGVVDDERDGSVASSVGWAVGAMISLSRQFYVEGRVERLFSGEISYVDPTTIEISSDGSVGYEKLQSRTDVLNIQIGVGLRF